MTEIEIGERLYRKVVTAVYDDDGRHYTAGCICRGADGSVSVSFYRYECGRGLVGCVKPGSEIVALLKRYHAALKAYLVRQDENARVTHTPHVGSGLTKRSQPLNNKGQRNQQTNEK